MRRTRPLQRRTTASATWIRGDGEEEARRRGPHAHEGPASHRIPMGPEAVADMRTRVEPLHEPDLDSGRRGKMYRGQQHASHGLRREAVVTEPCRKLVRRMDDTTGDIAGDERAALRDAVTGRSRRFLTLDPACQGLRTPARRHRAAVFDAAARCTARTRSSPLSQARALGAPCRSDQAHAAAGGFQVSRVSVCRGGAVIAAAPAVPGQSCPRGGG